MVVIDDVICEIDVRPAVNTFQNDRPKGENSLSLTIEVQVAMYRRPFTHMMASMTTTYLLAYQENE